MESTNIHHHQLQEDQLVGSSSSSSSLATPNCFYGVASNWTPNSFLEQGQQENIQLSSFYNSMAQDLGFNWANQSSAQDVQQYSMTKEDFSDNYYLKYTELLNNNQSSSCGDDQLGTKNLLNSSSSGATNINGRGLSQINFPSNLNQQGITNPGFLDMNQIGPMRDDFAYSFGYMQQPYLMPMFNSNKISAAETKRCSSSKMEPKSSQTAPKKSRIEARASCQPFKVRKEKLGDRIAALQQLVAPFGKTDTASVLMEAVGYIKFLQNQVETLSVPYMKASHNKMITNTTSSGPTEHVGEKTKRDLKSRGLCLVPLSCMSYITDGGVVWPPPHFGGAA